LSQVRNTLQRDLVREVMHENYTHPTAEEVYEIIHEKHPHISFATIYRNLNLLAEQGEITRLHMPEGPDHYDFTVNPHYHFLCKKCPRIMDVDVPYAPDFNVFFTDAATTESHILTLIGTCENC